MSKIPEVMPVMIARILGLLPGWEGYAIHTTEGCKTSRELTTRNNLLYINSKELKTMTVISIVSALLCSETSQPVKHNRFWIFLETPGNNFFQALAAFYPHIGRLWS
jgi:hypothetical protein